MQPKTKKKLSLSTPLKKGEKKTSSDYPSLHLRPSIEDKTLIDSKIEKLLSVLNAKRTTDQLMFKKNDIAIEALKRGLELIEKGVK